MAEVHNKNRTDSQVEAIKAPPHSLEAEQSVIGGLLLDNERWGYCCRKSSSERFL